MLISVPIMLAAYVLASEPSSPITPFGIILMPTIAKSLGNNNFLVRMNGRVSSPAKSDEIQATIEATNIAAVTESNATSKNIEERTSYFLTTALSNRVLSAEFVGATDLSPKPFNSSEAGIFDTTTTISVKPGSGDSISYSLDGLKTKNFITLADDKGFAIVSDVDDTLKITGVNSPAALLSNSMERPFQVVPGMPEYMASLKNLNAVSKPTFTYISNSPFQFHPSIEPFLTKSFPVGEHVNSILSSDALPTKVQDFKREETIKFSDFFPNRKLILIGDSGQSDPEAYGEVARLKGDRIACILIRKVVGFNKKKELTLNTDNRFLTAFKDIDVKKWKVFSDPSELPTADKIKAGDCQG